MLIEAILDSTDAEMKKQPDGKGVMATDVRHAFEVRLYRSPMPEEWQNTYLAHRSLKDALSDSQKRALEEAVVEILGKEYGGQDCTDCTAFGGAIDLGCCYCPCLEKGKAHDDKNLDKFFCSEAVAYLLKSVGILNEQEAADEYMPRDFTSEKLAAHAKGGEDPYEKEVFYG